MRRGSTPGSLRDSPPSAQEFEAIRGTERYLEGLDRLQMSQQYSTSGRLGQVAYIAEKPGG